MTRRGSRFWNRGWAGRWLARPGRSRWRGGRLGPRIVAIGGGTGLSTMLRGLKQHSSELTAVVSVGDDGGSSGRLRTAFGIAPPGDVRNCIGALSQADPVAEQLFQYRFATGGELDGDSLGNLMLAALTDLTGDFRAAIQEVSRLLRVRGRVLPVHDEKLALVATHTDGTKSTGEAQISAARRPIARLELRPRPTALATDIRDAITAADLVVLGPGSLFTSVIPPLLVPGMKEALLQTEAQIMYVCNVMTQPGETDQYSVAAHAKAIEAHTAPGLLDVVVANEQPVEEKLARRYEAHGQEPVALESGADWSLRAAVASAALVSATEVVRHDPDALSTLLLSLARRPARRPRLPWRRHAGSTTVRRVGDLVATLRPPAPTK